MKEFRWQKRFISITDRTIVVDGEDLVYLQGTDTGQMFVELFRLLVTLSNECEASGKWVTGTPLIELPLSEQIVVLHRMDHSIHTARLWTIQEGKTIAHTWELDVFFLLVKGDIINCLKELSHLKVSFFISLFFVISCNMLHPILYHLMLLYCWF